MALNLSELKAEQKKLLLKYARYYYGQKNPETVALLYRKSIEDYGPNEEATEMLAKIRQQLLSDQSNAPVR